MGKKIKANTIQKSKSMVGMVQAVSVPQAVPRSLPKNVFALHGEVAVLEAPELAKARVSKVMRKVKKPKGSTRPWVGRFLVLRDREVLIFASQDEAAAYPKVAPLGRLPLRCGRVRALAADGADTELSANLVKDYHTPAALLEGYTETWVLEVMAKPDAGIAPVYDRFYFASPWRDQRKTWVGRIQAAQSHAMTFEWRATHATYDGDYVGEWPESHSRPLNGDVVLASLAAEDAEQTLTGPVSSLAAAMQSHSLADQEPVEKGKKVRESRQRAFDTSGWLALRVEDEKTGDRTFTQLHFRLLDEMLLWYRTLRSSVPARPSPTNTRPERMALHFATPTIALFPGIRARRVRPPDICCLPETGD